MRKSETDDELFADSLRALKPASVELSIERLAFEAGRHAGRRSATTWRAVAAVMTIAGGCAFGLRSKPVTVRSERIVIVHERASPAESQPVVSSASYLRLRDAVIADGWDALPPPIGGGGLSQQVMGVRSIQ